MNKQELIKHIRALPYGKGPLKDTAEVNTGWLIRNIDQLDEPEKAVVKPFVAGWYEKNKGDFEANLLLFINRIFSISDGAKLNDFERWFLNASTKPFQTLVNMHQFGYEVEKEKRYLVKIKASGQYIMKNPDENVIFFYSKRVYSELTRKELEEADFGWVFDCPGIKIEEVTE